MSRPWMKFYPTDWRGDEGLGICSISARGLWIEMLCVMHGSEPYGELRINGKPVTTPQLASLVRLSKGDLEPILEELREAGVFSEEKGVIFSRRMKQDEDKAEKNRENGLSGGNPNIRRGTVPKEERVRPYRRTDSPVKTRRIYDRSSGNCHWCKKDISFEYFHIDHVLPICDGGTNDEKNLVASCALCNHKRARLVDPTGSPVNGGKLSDIKAQIPDTRDHIPESKLGEKSNGVSGGKKSTPPSHGQVYKDLIHLYPKTPDWEQYADEHRQLHGCDPPLNKWGGQWLPIKGYSEEISKNGLHPNYENIKQEKVK